MSKLETTPDTETKPSDEQHTPATVTRRSLLKKSVYHAPALVVLGSVLPVGRATAASFPGEPLRQRPPGPANQPPGRND